MRVRGMLRKADSLSREEEDIRIRGFYSAAVQAVQTRRAEGEHRKAGISQDKSSVLALVCNTRVLVKNKSCD